MMNILFVCTGNTCRSSMAEVIFKDMIKEIDNNLNEIEVHSAGIFAINGMGATPQAISAMESRGINLTKHRAKLLTIQMIKDADLILTMTVKHKSFILKLDSGSEKKVFTLKEYVSLGQESSLDIVDPFGHPVEKYIETAKEIREALEEILRKI